MKARLAVGVVTNLRSLNEACTRLLISQTNRDSDRGKNDCNYYRGRGKRDG